MHISSSTEKFLLVYSYIEKSYGGFISANHSLHFYISVIPTSERSPTAMKTPAQGFTWIVVIDIYMLTFHLCAHRRSKN